MNKTIWKVQLETTDKQTIKLPIGAELLSVQVQNNIPCIWALVYPDMGKGNIQIEIYGTGHPIKDKVERRFIGTYQLNDGELVFHVFEILKTYVP